MKNKNLWEPFQGNTSGDIDLRKMKQINKNNLTYPNFFLNLNPNLLLCKAPTWDICAKGLCHCTLNAFSSQTLYPWVPFPSLLAKAKIECFHMTSRRPYWCPKTIKRRPCWCSKPVLWELNSFLMQTLSFVPTNLHRCWPRE